MRIQFKNQKFQADAAKAVVDVFAGQPYLTPSYMMDRGSGFYQMGLNEDGFWNACKKFSATTKSLLLKS